MKKAFVPVARFESIRIVLAFATHHDFKLHQIDAKSAFLNGRIKEEVYVKQPAGFEDPSYPNHVYKLRNMLYWIKQPRRAWYKCLRDFLIKETFKIRKVDATFLTKCVGSDIFVCQIYIDNIIFGQLTKLCVMSLLRL